MNLSNVCRAWQQTRTESLLTMLRGKSLQEKGLEFPPGGLLKPASSLWLLLWLTWTVLGQLASCLSACGAPSRSVSTRLSPGWKWTSVGSKRNISDGRGRCFWAWGRPPRCQVTRSSTEPRQANLVQSVCVRSASGSDCWDGFKACWLASSASWMCLLSQQCFAGGRCCLLSAPPGCFSPLLVLVLFTRLRVLCSKPLWLVTQ